MNIQVFENPEFQLRVSRDGDAFRVEAPGLAKALGFRDSYDLVRSIPEDEKGSEIVRTPGGDQQGWYVTESGFYRALGQRQAARIKDAAAREMVVRFQSWVYGEVLPGIRRTGGYQAAPVSIEVTINAFAEAYHDEHVVSAAGSILSFRRWRKPRKGIERFHQLMLDINLPAIAAEQKKGITRGKGD